MSCGFLGAGSCVKRTDDFSVSVMSSLMFSRRPLSAVMTVEAIFKVGWEARGPEPACLTRRAADQLIISRCLGSKLAMDGCCCRLP